MDGQIKSIIPDISLYLCLLQVNSKVYSQYIDAWGRKIASKSIHTSAPKGYISHPILLLYLC